jgi:hypothetical protein
MKDVMSSESAIETDGENDVVRSAVMAEREPVHACHQVDGDPQALHACFSKHLLIESCPSYSGREAMAPKELKALRMLMDSPGGLYGSELVSLSDGLIGRGTVYALLDKLVGKGFVREVEEPPTPALQLARTRHFITASGKRAVMEFCEQMDLSLPARAGLATGGA